MWMGGVSAVIELLNYFVFFAKLPFTLDVPWANFMLFAVGLPFLAVGLRRAFCPPGFYRGRMSGPILATLSAAILGFFCYAIFIQSRDIPSAADAPKVGEKAPGFSLSATNGKKVSLADLLSAPIADRAGPAHSPKGVLLVFYRGYGDPSATPSCGG